MSIKMIFGTGVSAAKQYHDLLPLIQKAIHLGITSFDTAPSYGTESVLGECIHSTIASLGLKRDDVYIQTKIDAWQMQTFNGNIETFCDSALQTMQLDYFDALLVHWPIPEYIQTTWDCLKQIKNKGLCKTIGICNVRKRNLIAYKKMQIVPEIVQIERHPLFTAEETIVYCKSEGITVQAYSPLCKMHPSLQTNDFLDAISKKYKKNKGQVILKWHLQTGVIPVFTTTKISRLQEYANISDFKLTEDELNIISSFNTNYKLYLESLTCPGI